MYLLLFCLSSILSRELDNISTRLVNWYHYLQFEGNRFFFCYKLSI